jgi:hypothetical protein
MTSNESSIPYKPSVPEVGRQLEEILSRPTEQSDSVPVQGH